MTIRILFDGSPARNADLTGAACLRDWYLHAPNRFIKAYTHRGANNLNLAILDAQKIDAVLRSAAIWISTDAHPPEGGWPA